MTFDLVGKAVKNLRLPTVDYNGSPIKIIPAQEGDVNSRFFNVTLFDDRGDIDLSCYTKVMLNATLPDGSLQTSDGDIDKKNNVAICKIAGSMLSQTGKVSCDVLFVGKDKNDEDVSLTSQTFYVFANRSQSGDNAISGNDNRTLFVQWLEQMEQLRDEAKEAAIETKEVASEVKEAVIETNEAASEAKEAVIEIKEAASEAKEAASEAKAAAETFRPAATLSGNEADKAPSVQAVNEGLKWKFDKTKIFQAMGESESAVMSQAAVTTALRGKVNSIDKVEKTTVYARYYRAEENGGCYDGTITIDNKNRPNNLAVFTSKAVYGTIDSGAFLQTTTPVNDYHCANKKFVEGTVEPIKASVANIEAAILGRLYVTRNRNTNGSFYVEIPSDALPYFYIGSVSVVFANDNDEVEYVNAKAIVFQNSEGGQISKVEISTPQYVKIPDGATRIYIDAWGTPPTIENAWASFADADCVFQVKVGV